MFFQSISGRRLPKFGLVAILGSLLPGRLFVKLRFAQKKRGFEERGKPKKQNRTNKNKTEKQLRTDKTSTCCSNHIAMHVASTLGLRPGHIGGSCSHTTPLPVPPMDFTEGKTQLDLSTNVSVCLFD